MTTDLETIVEHHEREGRRLYARWDAELFRSIIFGPGQRLAQSIDGSPNAERVFLGWLRLVVEAVGLGYVRPGIASSSDKLTFPPENLIELLLLDALPRRISAHDPNDRLALLAKAWNLGEGLLGEPAWLNLCVTSAMARLITLTDWEGHIIRILQRTMAPRARSSFVGPFAVRMVSMAGADRSFLPGKMHFAQSALLCVHDRKRPTFSAGVLLGAKDTPTLVFPGPCLAEKTEPDPGLPSVSLTRAGLTVGDCRVPLPHWTRGHAVVASRAGIIAASALDSQRLWIVETP